MKKVLSTVAALGLVVGFAATASALDTPHEVGKAIGYDREKDTPTAPGVDLFSVKGNYSLVGAYQDNGNGAGSGVELRGGAGFDELGADAFWFHSFKTTMTMHVGDKIAVKGELRYADRDVWGVSDTAEHTSTTNAAGQSVESAGGRQIDVRKIYMEYDSPIGKWRMGRTPAAAWYGKFINSASQGNRLMWWPNFIPKPFSVLLFTQKLTEADATMGGSDLDRDGYYAGIEHKADFGKTAFAWWMTRQGNFQNATEAPLLNDLRYYGKYNLANFTLEAEVSYLTGDLDRDGLAVGTTATSDPETDADAMAVYLDLSTKLGNVTVGGQYFYQSGDDNPNDGDEEAHATLYGGSGDDFNPYHILTGDWTGMMNNDKAVGMQQANLYQAGYHVLGLRAGMAISPKLSVSGALGYAMAADEMSGWDDEIGMEFDVNAAYKLLDNLTYTVHFGFLSTGDFFKGDSAAPMATDVNDITFLANQITMNF